MPSNIDLDELEKMYEDILGSEDEDDSKIDAQDSIDDSLAKLGLTATGDEIAKDPPADEAASKPATTKSDQQSKEQSLDTSTPGPPIDEEIPIEPVQEHTHSKPIEIAQGALDTPFGSDASKTGDAPQPNSLSQDDAFVYQSKTSNKDKSVSGDTKGTPDDIFEIQDLDKSSKTKTDPKDSIVLDSKDEIPAVSDRRESAFQELISKMGSPVDLSGTQVLAARDGPRERLKPHNVSAQPDASSFNETLSKMASPYDLSATFAAANAHAARKEEDQHGDFDPLQSSDPKKSDTSDVHDEPVKTKDEKVDTTASPETKEAQKFNQAVGDKLEMAESVKDDDATKIPKVVKVLDSNARADGDSTLAELHPDKSSKQTKAPETADSITTDTEEPSTKPANASDDLVGQETERAKESSTKEKAEDYSTHDVASPSHGSEEEEESTLTDSTTNKSKDSGAASGPTSKGDLEDATQDDIEKSQLSSPHIEPLDDDSNTRNTNIASLPDSNKNPKDKSPKSSQNAEVATSKDTDAASEQKPRDQQPAEDSNNKVPLVEIAKEAASDAEEVNPKAEVTKQVSGEDDSKASKVPTEVVQSESTDDKVSEGKGLEGPVNSEESSDQDDADVSISALKAEAEAFLGRTDAKAPQSSLKSAGKDDGNIASTEEATRIRDVKASHDEHEDVVDKASSEDVKKSLPTSLSTESLASKGDHSGVIESEKTVSTTDQSAESQSREQAHASNEGSDGEGDLKTVEKTDTNPGIKTIPSVDKDASLQSTESSAGTNEEKSDSVGVQKPVKNASSGDVSPEDVESTAEKAKFPIEKNDSAVGQDAETVPEKDASPVKNALHKDSEKSESSEKLPVEKTAEKSIEVPQTKAAPLSGDTSVTDLKSEDSDEKSVGQTTSKDSDKTDKITDDEKIDESPTGDDTQTKNELEDKLKDKKAPTVESREEPEGASAETQSPQKNAPSSVDQPSTTEDSLSGSDIPSKEKSVTDGVSSSTKTDDLKENHASSSASPAQASTAKGTGSGKKSTAPDDSKVVYLYVSLASGGRGTMANFNRAQTILKSYGIDFTPVEITMDDSAKRLWKYKGIAKNKKLPAVVRDREVKLGYDELLEADEYEEVEDIVFEEF